MFLVFGFLKFLALVVWVVAFVLSYSDVEINRRLISIEKTKDREDCWSGGCGWYMYRSGRAYHSRGKNSGDPWFAKHGRNKSNPRDLGCLAAEAPRTETNCEWWGFCFMWVCLNFGILQVGFSFFGPHQAPLGDQKPTKTDTSAPSSFISPKKHQHQRFWGVPHFGVFGFWGPFRCLAPNPLRRSPGACG